jgi:8-oxo-dGTP pyrophosphatase MutT (NUDIX family)
MSTRPGTGPPEGRRGSRIDRRVRDGIEQSCGGVAVRGDEVLVITPAGRHRVMALPKGAPQEGETDRETAGREIREETGVTVDVGERLGDVAYVYRRGGRRIHKVVHYYLCSYVSGSTDDHDDEVEDARWIPLEQALTALTYPGERRLIARAMSKLAPDR